ncbi:hypothetical protein FB45DRAFT_792746 [Roridomyces roridus]|uniref:CxC5 like cysteine cluster associated with KDZ domain-containing protein n=1 Tax=Roridomyces roridus TaxID=1738132 RepID=A0AAD7BT43_9AGAR|nr:hypothetical protein FB45DRAFT_792746 [Roridomyces roridus]
MSPFCALRRDPLLQNLTFTQISLFIRLLSVLKNDITLCQPVYVAPDVPPPFLPAVVAEFVCDAVEIAVEAVCSLWDLFKDDVWCSCDTKLSAHEEGLFREHGWKVGLTSLTLYPPTHHCQNPDCKHSKPLKKPEARQVVVYTQGNGVVPAWAVHLYCPDCNTNYHHNYCVQGGMRTYYGDQPNYIQIGEHQFAERKLIGLWISLMLVGWVSATNCALAYDMALSEKQERDFAAGGWQFGSLLTPNHVWDAFIILTLLDYNDRKGTCLYVPHTGDQRDRFTAAMRARNREVIEEGQDEIAHCCDRCMRVVRRPDGTIREIQIIVGDGMAMGHRRCQCPRCTAELCNNRHRFCPTHMGLNSVCSIVGCDEAVVAGKKSCADPGHAEMERLHYERGTAAFTLTDRLQRHRRAHPKESVPDLLDGQEDDEDEEWFEVDGKGDVQLRRRDNPGSVGVDDTTAPAVPCEAAKSDTGNRKFKALFGGSRTHNEQILVRPCGVIVSRATFYNAEAVSNVLLFVQKTFSVTRAFKPEHFVYDTNCDAKQQVEANPEAWWWFKDVGMSVDVFHFLHKHKISHEFCQEHCNPADHPELMGPDGKWFFNTSVAEQTNVWLGGYHSICREMLPVKYNFFLDEMIRLRNQQTVAKLAVGGHNPRERLHRMD